MRTYLDKSMNYQQNSNNHKKEIDIDDIYYIADEKQELDDIIDKDSYNKMIAKFRVPVESGERTELL